jgi:hypothetical protein
VIHEVQVSRKDRSGFGTSDIARERESLMLDLKTKLIARCAARHLIVSAVAPSLVAGALNASASATAGESGGPVLHVVVERGDQVPEQEPGIAFQDFGEHPLAEQLSSGPFDPPGRIDREGNVSFHAYIGETLPDDLLAPSGYFKIVDGVPQVIALIGDPAPGTDSVFAPPIFFPRTPFISGGVIAFDAGFGDNPFNQDFGAWTDRPGALEALAIEGDHLPGMPPEAMIDPAFGARFAGSTIYFFSEFHGPGLTDTPPEGSWRLDADGGFEPLALSEMQAPGLPPGQVFGESNLTIINGPIGTFGFNDLGRFALTGFTKGPGITITNDEAIWVETDAGLEVLLQEGDAPAEGPFPNGSVFASSAVTEGAFAGQAMTPIGLNNNGAVVFPAQVDIPGDPPRVPTIWTTRNGEFELILRGQQVGVKFSEPGDPAPDVPDGTFITAIFADINDRGDIMMIAFVEDDDSIFTSIFGVWIDRGNGIESVGREEGPVPGHPGLTFIPETNNVRGIQDAFLNPDGSVLFTGFYRDENNHITEGAFLQAADGSARPVIEEGTTHEVIGPSGTTMRTVDRFRFGAGITEDGVRIVEVFL